jgi:hypothetical protein
MVGGPEKEPTFGATGGSTKVEGQFTSTGPTKLETQGWDPKVIAQALATLVVGVAAYFGFELSPEVAGGIAVVLGILAGRIAPAPDTKRVPK